MCLVTASYKAKPSVKEEAQTLANQLGLPYVVRKNKSIPRVLEENHASWLVTMGADGPTIHFSNGDSHAFHLSMAHLRCLHLQRGGEDHLVNAVEIVEKFIGGPVHHILDCTLGLGADAIVMAYSHDDWEITGVEASLPLWITTHYGLQHFVHKDERLTKAMRRIHAVHNTFETVLNDMNPNSVDVVYLDPMFEVPVMDSPQFKSLRTHICHTPLIESTMQRALTVARYGVIIKERPFASVFERWLTTYWEGGTYSRIGYGIYDATKI